MMSTMTATVMSTTTMALRERCSISIETADGYGDLSSAMYACPGHEPEGYIEQSGDCDDDAASNHPDAIEVCDGEDNNCNGVVDEPTAADVTLWYQDSDGDGFGSMVVSQPSCTQPSGYVADNTDCNDNEATAYVGADEYCNGYDDNCDGAVDETRLWMPAYTIQILMETAMGPPWQAPPFATHSQAM